MELIDPINYLASIYSSHHIAFEMAYRASGFWSDTVMTDSSFFPDDTDVEQQGLITSDTVHDNDHRTPVCVSCVRSLLVDPRSLLSLTKQ